MANIAALLKRIESGTLSYEEKLSALSQVEQSLQDMRQKKQEAIQSNVMLIVDALKQMQVKVEQQLEEAKAIVPQKGPKGDKGDKGDRGLDGVPGKDGRNGIDGKDGKDGNDGISVTDAKIDFDGSLVITLSSGREINVGEVLPLDVSDKIKVIANGGGTSQTVVDTLTSLQNQINTLTGIDGVLGDMAQQNANNVAITGGAINGATIGATTPAAGTFTTLTATGQTSLGGAAGSESLRAISVASAVNWIQAAGNTAGTGPILSATGSDTNVDFLYSAKGTAGSHVFRTNTTTRQFQVSHTASAVNYVQVTGAATGGYPTILGTGSDATVGLQLAGKGGTIDFRNNGIGTAIQFSVAFTSSSVNYLTATGSGASGNAPRLYAVGSDTNIALAFQSKGTGAIDLAAGSSGVNISNGGTVTAITRTASGSGYTSLPSVAVSAPTTAGGVQATATCTLGVSSATIGSGGTGYTLNDVITVSGGTFGTAAVCTVSGVSGGVVTAVTFTGFGTYTVLPTNPASTTGGTGTGLTLNITAGGNFVNTGFTITNAGSGYVEQPTVSFSGGGGSGAAAYASVGSGSIIRSLGSTGTQSLSFYVPSGEILRLRDTGSPGTYVLLNTTATGANVIAQGSTNATWGFNSNGTGQIDFGTNGNTGNTQLRVSHTASAVNYVQVTGGATGNNTTISTQGSDGSIGLTVLTRGTSATGSLVSFASNLTQTNYTFRIAAGSTANANYLQVAPASTTASPVLSAQGTDTNIGLNLTTKGTGVVDVNTGNGTQFRVADTFSGGTATNYIQVQGRATFQPVLSTAGASTNIALQISTKGTGDFSVWTNGAAQQQFAVTHTASAVNYVQVTGAATGSFPIISAQGSDATLGLNLYSKGAARINFFNNNGTNRQVSIGGNGTTAVNYIGLDGSIAGSAPVVSVAGTDTNIDLALTPKGTGYVQFGAYTGTALTIAGYIEIKDSGGTVRKLAVVA